MIEGMQRPPNGGNGGGQKPNGNGGKPNGRSYGWGAVVEWILAWGVELTHDVVLRGCAVPFFLVSCAGIFYLATHLSLPHRVCWRGNACFSVSGYGDIAAQAIVLLALILVFYVGIMFWRAGTFSDNVRHVAEVTGVKQDPVGPAIAETRGQINNLLVGPAEEPPKPNSVERS